ncbi:MAG: DUF4140 domain-containing protein [Owenweeksia sp.]|nr:DUF4140 domain-containing protein [Owenweeksia sp.]
MRITPIFTMLMALPALLMAQPEILVSSDIEEVTVFTRGAEVTRQAEVRLEAGFNKLVFEDLSPTLDEKSIQFNGKGDFSGTEPPSLKSVMTTMLKMPEVKL